MTSACLLTSLIVIASPGAGALFTIATGLSRGARASVVAAHGVSEQVGSNYGNYEITANYGDIYRLHALSRAVSLPCMARLSRIAVPGVPHDVTQRGNRRIAIFAEAGDYALYRDLLAERLRHHHVACWAYCLMPNHVHLILTPPDGDAAARMRPCRAASARRTGATPPSSTRGRGSKAPVSGPFRLRRHG